MTSYADHMTIAQIINDFATTRGNLTDRGAREDLAAILEQRMVAAHGQGGEGLDFIRAIVGAWDCCGTCAGGVLLAHDKAIKAEALREAADMADGVGHHWSGAPALAFFALAGDFRDRAEQIRTTETEGTK